MLTTMLRCIKVRGSGAEDTDEAVRYGTKRVQQRTDTQSIRRAALGLGQVYDNHMPQATYTYVNVRSTDSVV